MMFRVLFLLLNLLIASTFSFQLSAFPEDEVLSIEDQIKLYRKAYEPFKSSEQIDVKKTPIPGLIPLVRMGYSYTKKLLQNDQDQIPLLKNFWEETDKAIGKNKLTLQYCKNTNIRLAFLLSDKKEKAPFFHKLPLEDLYSSGDWKDLHNYPMYYKVTGLKVHKFPFCFETTLYQPTGELPLEALF